MPGGHGGDAEPQNDCARAERSEKPPKRTRQLDAPEATWPAEELAKLASELCNMRRGSGLKRTLAVGELLLHRLFGGNSDAWHNRRRNKACSIRRLAKSRGCPFSKSALTQAVSVYVASRDLANLVTFRHVQASHVLSVVSLPPQQRLQLLGQAERDRWSVRTLRQSVVTLKGANGAAAASDAASELTQFHSALEELAETARRVSDSIPPDPGGALFGDLAHELSHFKARLAQLRSAGSGAASAEPDFTMDETRPRRSP